ncbi:MAG: hypothetical protein ACAF41_27985 [Leptolyngbya sp. BL-A-14]
MIEISLEKRCLHIDPITGAIAQAAYSRAAMKPELMERLEQLSAPYGALPSWSVHPNTIRALVRRYSEQAAFYPLEEIAQWINYQRYGLFLLAGYQPLFYQCTENKGINPNKSATAAIGEACLGLTMQYLYQGRLLARPVADYPDAVCADPTSNTIYLGEAKATAARTVDDVKRVVDGELPRFIPFVVAANSLDTTQTKVLGLLVGTTVITSTQFHCAITEVRV